MRLAQRVAPSIVGTSLHYIAIGTAPAVEREEEARCLGWYSPVELRGDVQLTDDNAQ